MATLMDKLKVEENRLDQEQEDSHGDYDKMKLVFEKKVDLYKRYLKKSELTHRMNRLTLQNKKEWAMSHLLSLIVHIETTNKFSELTKRIYRLEKKTAGLPEYS